MKQSIDARVNHLLGFICFVIASIFALIEIATNQPEIAIGTMAFGMASMCLFWIMGLEREIYGQEEEGYLLPEEVK